MKPLFLSFLITFLFQSCSSSLTEEKTQPPMAQNESTVVLTRAQLRQAQLEGGTVTRRAMSGRLRVTGKVDVPPQNMVSVSFPLGGYLRETRLLPGMHVSKGSVLAVLQDLQYIQLQQDYLTARARLQFLEADYRRQQELNASKAASDKAFEQVRSDWTSQRILVSSLGKKLQLLGIRTTGLNENTITQSVNVYAPINGYVTKVNVNIGKYVNPTDVLFELVNPADIHLVLTVFQKDVAALRVGQRVLAFTNEAPEQPLPATVLLMGKDIAPDGSVEVHCHFENENHRLLPGTYLNAEVETENHDALVVPETAVVRSGNQTYVFEQVADTAFRLLLVEVGATQEGWTALTAPAEAVLEKKRIVVKNAYSLLMALKNVGEEE